jgi:hypothetical protein
MLEDNGIVSILRSDSPFGRRPEPTGTHCPQGIFLARGPSFRRGASLDDLSIVDVAPLLLHSLGVSIPDDLDGRLPASAFDPDELQRRPPRYAAAPPDVLPVAEGLERPTTGLDYDPDEEAFVLKRLQALGYLE